jgi:uncharacterized protein YxjI
MLLTESKCIVDIIQSLLCSLQLLSLAKKLLHIKKQYLIRDTKEFQLLSLAKKLLHIKKQYLIRDTKEFLEIQ